LVSIYELKQLETSCNTSVVTLGYSSPTNIKATLICPRNDIKHTRMHSAAGGLPPPPDALAAYSASQIPWLGLGRGEEENGGK